MRIEKIYADGDYLGEFIGKVRNVLDYDMGITLRIGKSLCFKLLSKRWVVERSFALLEYFRRLEKIMKEQW